MNANARIWHAEPTVALELMKLAGALPEMEELFADQFKTRKMPALVVALVVDGQLRWSKAWGDRDAARKQPADLDTVFRIASLTKSFTAASVLQLRDEGKLSLDDPAEKYLPELEQLAYPTHDSPRITVRHLLSHGGGFPEDNPWGDLQLGLSEADFGDLLSRGLAFSHAPGAEFEYSNTGFALLGRLVQRVSGERLQDYLSRYLLQPLGMASTVWKREDVPPGHLALGYGHRESAPGPALEGGLREEPQLGDGAYAAMGGLYTSMRDLSRYAAWQLDAWPPRDEPESGPLRRSSRREMQLVARHVGLDVRRGDAGELRVRALEYGYGLGSQESCEFDRIVSHSGGLPGFGSVMVLYPENGFGFVAASNLTYAAPDTRTAADFLFKKGAVPARKPSPAPDLVAAQQDVSALLTKWDPALAQARFDRTAWYYEAPSELQAHLDKLRAGLGACGPGELEAENALRGTAKLLCERGSLEVSVTLTPALPPLIQHLELKPSIPPGEPLARAAERAVALTLRWDDRYAGNLLSPSLDAAAAKKQLDQITDAGCGQPEGDAHDGEACSDPDPGRHAARPSTWVPGGL